jgi:hypothetical protein
MTQPFDARPPRDAALRREGIVAGILGAVVVAVFYLVVDLVHGRPLMTPSVLGEAFVLHVPVSLTQPNTAAVIAYSALHLIAFIAFGLLLTALIRTSEHSVIARDAAIQLLVAFLVFFYGILTVGSEVVRGMFSFLGVLAANALAGAVMIWWLLYRHPELRAAFRRTPLDTDDLPV